MAEFSIAQKEDIGETAATEAPEELQKAYSSWMFLRIWRVWKMVSWQPGF